MPLSDLFKPKSRPDIPSYSNLINRAFNQSEAVTDLGEEVAQPEKWVDGDPEVYAAAFYRWQGLAGEFMQTWQELYRTKPPHKSLWAFHQLILRILRTPYQALTQTFEMLEARSTGDNRKANELHESANNLNDSMGDLYLRLGAMLAQLKRNHPDLMAQLELPDWMSAS